MLNKEKKSAEIKIRCTPKFKSWVKKISQESNRSMSEIVMIGCGKYNEKYNSKTKKIIHQADPLLVREIAKIGNNLNQIARKINSSNSAIDTIEILATLETIKRDIEEIKNGSI